MSPFDNPYSLTSELENKISNQISGQVPMFVTDEHPLFVKFLQYYYEFLEAGEITLTATIDNVAQETVSSNYILDELGQKIVTETGAGTLGKFTVGETITGGTSKATAKVLADDIANGRLFITAKTQFINGEAVTGGTSSATGKVVKYRANPIQNIQQLLSYADVDNTIYDFLDQLRDSFMNAIPKTLTSGVDTRNLIKNIRELYRTKGTSEGHKIFMKILLGENAEIFYPNQYMLRSSAGKWNYVSKIRCSPGTNVTASEVIGRTLTGATSGASVVISNASTLSEAGDAVIEFDIDSSSLDGTFINGETCTAISKTEDVSYSFIIRQLINDFTLTKSGILYSENDVIDIDSNTSIGNGRATAKVISIKSGSVNEVVVDDAGTGYQVGEPLLFTTTETDVDTAAGFVSVIDGSLQLDGTDITTSNAGDYIVLEEGSVYHEEHLEIELETSTQGIAPYAIYGIDTAYSNTKGYYYPLYLDKEEAENTTITKAGATVNGAIGQQTPTKNIVVDTNVGTIAKDMVVFGTGLDPSTTIKVSTVTDQQNIILDTAVTLADNVVLSFRSIKTAVHTHKFLEYPNLTFYMPTANSNHYKDTYDSSTYNLYGNHLTLNATGSSSEHANFNIITEQTQTTLDTYGTNADRIGLEEGVTSAFSNQGSIARLFVSDKGGGYTSLPTVSVSTTSGTSSKLLSTTTDIGGVSETEITNIGFKYSEVPASDFRANFVLKDVTGTFAVNNTLTTHTGTVRNWEPTTQLLEVSIEDVLRISLNVTDQEEIQLEDSLYTGTDNKTTLMQLNNTVVEFDQVITEDGDRVVLDADSTLDGYITLEDGNGETSGSAIIYESETGTFFPPIQLEGATGDGGTFNILNEGSGDVILSETSISDGSSATQGSRILTESSRQNLSNLGVLDITTGEIITLHPRSAVVGGIGDPLIYEAVIIEETGAILFDQTDANGTDAGSKLQNEEFGDNNSIIMDGTDSSGSDANARLLQDSDNTAGNIAIDGTNSSSFHAGDNIIHEDVGIDYSAGTTVITDSGGASGTIVNADVAKGNLSVGINTQTTGSYGIAVESRISEDLIRIQDSYYYQDFSYEVQTDSGGTSYINELKKAVHPSGFVPFGKVSIASSISVALGTVGSSLGGGYTSDTDTYSPILASTLQILFTETMQRRLKSLEVIDGNYEEQIILEDAELQTNIDDTIVFNGTDSSSLDAGDSLLLETPVFAFPDFEGIEITHSSDAGAFGALLLNGTDSSSSNGGDKIVSESAELITNNLVLDQVEDSGHIIGTDAGSDLVLDGIDSSGTDAGESIELENAASDGNIKIAVEPIANINQPSLLNEDGGTQQLETSGKGGSSDYDLSLVSFVTTKINIPQPTPRHLSTGAITIQRAAFSERGVIELEGHKTQGKLMFNLVETDSATYATHTGFDGSYFQLEDGTDPNVDNAPSFYDITTYTNDEIVLDGTDGSSSNAGDNIITEDATNANSSAGADILITEDSHRGAITVDDLVRPDILLMSSGDDFNTERWATPIEPVGVLLEQSGENGVFRLEDETTVSTTHGDSIILEDKTGIGVGDNLLLEFQRVELETNINTGTIPFENYTNSKLEPLTRSAEVKLSESGQISLEDEANESTNILLEAGTSGSRGILILDGINVASELIRK